MSIFRIASAAILALCVTSARAGTITYDFVERTVGPSPVIPVAILAFLDPPASPTSGWITANASGTLQPRAKSPCCAVTNVRSFP